MVTIPPTAHINKHPDNTNRRGKGAQIRGARAAFLEEHPRAVAYRDLSALDYQARKRGDHHRPPLPFVRRDGGRSQLLKQLSKRLYTLTDTHLQTTLGSTMQWRNEGCQEPIYTSKYDAIPTDLYVMLVYVLTTTTRLGRIPSTTTPPPPSSTPCPSATSPHPPSPSSSSPRHPPPSPPRP